MIFCWLLSFSTVLLTKQSQTDRHLYKHTSVAFVFSFVIFIIFFFILFFRPVNFLTCRLEPSYFVNGHADFSQFFHLFVSRLFVSFFFFWFFVVRLHIFSFIHSSSQCHFKNANALCQFHISSIIVVFCFMMWFWYINIPQVFLSTVVIWSGKMVFCCWCRCC